MEMSVGREEGLASGMPCPASRTVSAGHRFSFRFSFLPSLGWISFQTFGVKGGCHGCSLHLSRPKSSGRGSSFPSSQRESPGCTTLAHDWPDLVLGPSLSPSVAGGRVARTKWLPPGSAEGSFSK